jgi:uncharacterized Tic20 family protein
MLEVSNVQDEQTQAEQIHVEQSLSTTNAAIVPGPTQNEKTMAALAHGLVVLMILFGFLAFVGLLVLYFTQRSKSKFIESHGRQAVGYAAPLFVIGMIVVAMTAAAIVSSLATGTVSSGMDTVQLLSYAVILLQLAAAYPAYLAYQGNEFRYPLIGSFIANLGSK